MIQLIISLFAMEASSKLPQFWMVGRMADFPNLPKHRNPINNRM